jgi:hypothetical protein
VQHRHTLKYADDGEEQPLALWGKKELLIEMDEEIGVGVDDEGDIMEEPLPVPPPLSTRNSAGRRRGSAAPQQSPATGMAPWDAAAVARAAAWLNQLSCATAFGAAGEPPRHVAQSFEGAPDRAVHADYYARIQRPVSLESLRLALLRGGFATQGAFVAETERMFDNALAFNAHGTQLHGDAIALRSLFRSALAAPADAQQQPQAQQHLGRPLRVYWAEERTHFAALVLAHAPQRGRLCHLVRYEEDGVVEWLDLEDPEYDIQWGDVPAHTARASRRRSSAPGDWGAAVPLLAALANRACSAAACE